MVSLHLYRFARESREKFRFRGIFWVLRGAEPPAPQSVKLSVLRRWSRLGDQWIETGTYLGSTTAFLSKRATSVVTIEPEPRLAQLAERRFARKKNVTVINATSEDAFTNAVRELTGSVAFWLDGHYSAGITHRADEETPAKMELEAIAKEIGRFTHVTVFVDDFRSFSGSRKEKSSYPPRAFLVDWAESQGFSWTVEHDIFVAQSRS